jgi:CRISPR-associated protein Csx10
MSTLTFFIHFRSDYHVGSGQRSASVDSTLFRDADRLPALRGTTVAALLRDGLRRLILTGALPGHKPICQASGLPAQEPDSADPQKKKTHPLYCGQFGVENSPCLVCRIFGSPRTIKPWAVSSARPLHLETPSIEPKHSHSWGTQEATRVRVDPRTRRAEAGKLFSREEGDGRLVFRFTVSRRENSGEPDAALIVAAARMVRNLGASRRRGRGECFVHLVEVDGVPAAQAEWLGKFEATWLKGQAGAQRPGTALTAMDAPELQPAGDVPFRLRLTIRADEPILIARRAQAGNEFEGLSTIPGTAVRGALATLTAQRVGLNDARSRAFFTEMFYSDRLKLSALYPVTEYTGEKKEQGQLRMTIPSPRDLLVCKLHGVSDDGQVNPLWYLGASIDPNTVVCAACAAEKHKTRLEPLERFITLAANLYGHDPLRRIEMHNQISPETGRVAEANLFGYEALASSQHFMGEVICSDKATWEALRTAAGLPEIGKRFAFRLGKASRRGYGSATAVFEEMSAAEPLWIGRPLAGRIQNKQAPIIITLLSDTIVLDRWGRFFRGFETAWLEEALGVAVTVNNQYVAVRDVDAFNMQLGLPRWRDTALAAGSAALIQRSDGQAWDVDRLAMVERQGVGLRQNEGFGRVAFNHPVYSPGADLNDLQYPLHQDLRLSGAVGSQLFTVERNFFASWEKALGELPFDGCNHDRFQGVARLLRAEKKRSLDDLRERLSRLGRRDNFADDLPTKDENWFETNGRMGVQEIQAALDELASLLNGTEYAEHRTRLSALGVEALAELVAEKARSSKEG